MLEYPIITICGSTRFEQEILEAHKTLTTKGYIVLSCFAPKTAMNETQIQTLNDMHRRRIAMSGAIYVVNPNSYIGESVKSEIEFARQLGLTIMSSDPIAFID